VSKVPSNIEWRRWGEIDPLYGVAAWEGKARGESAPWTDAEFYELGRSDWEDFRRHWEHYGLNRTSCVEIGCGAGRITLHLAKDFQHTHAVDVSQGMMAYAQAHVAGAAVTFHLSDGARLPLGDGAVTAVFSTHVFQHFDSLQHASAYFAEVARVLAPGGSLMIHLPIHSWPAMSGVFDLLYRLRTAVAQAKATLLRPLIARGRARPIMRRTSYPMPYVYATLARCGLTDVEIRIIAPRSNHDPHPFVLARKR
jgi:SAM-dependent methyltransferase